MQANLLRFHLLQQDNPHGGLGSEEDGIHHHDRTDSDPYFQSSQAHDPPTEMQR